jgi:dTDP-4-amino-4,6-dideoxygalactose transaminase
MSIQESSLAVNGARPIRTKPFAPWPHFEPDEIEAAAEVLRSGRINYWTGQEGTCFEKEFAAFTECRFGVAVANGTVGLELALYGLGIGSGDEVIVPSRTFVATASCVVMRGATPVVVDVDPITQNLTAKTILPAITRKTKAIISVHLAGWPCEMDSILKLARGRGLRVIEDCAQSHGAQFRESSVGSFGDVASFSFCQDKIMSTAGEGGMLTTNDEDVWSRAWSFKDHGKSYASAHRDVQGYGFRWLHDSFGSNWRLTEFQSALGRVLLRKLPDAVAKRRKNAAIITEGIRCVPGIRVTVPPNDVYHSYYKYYAFVRPECLLSDWTRDRVVSAIRAEGIPCQTGSCSEIYLEKAFPKEMRPPHRLPVAKTLGETSLMFLVHPTLTERDMIDTYRAVEKVMSVATRPEFSRATFSEVVGNLHN